MKPWKFPLILAAALTAFLLGHVTSAQHPELRPASDLQYVVAQPGDSYWAMRARLGLTCTHTYLWEFNNRRDMSVNGGIFIPPQCLGGAPSSSTTSSTSTTTTQAPASTTSAPPTTTSTPPTSGLDSLLRPPAGKLLNGVQQEQSGWTGWLAEAGQAPHIWHRYANSGTDVRNYLNAAPADVIPLVNFKPNGLMGLAAYQAIIAGQHNASIDQAADAILAYGKPMFLAPMHEPENDGTAADDATYAQAFRYIVERVRARGADPVIVWNMMGAASHSTRYDALYPGHDVVDWLAADLYIISSTTVDTWGEFLNQAGWSTPQKGWYNWATAKAPGKPLMLAEWGIGTAVVPATPTKLFGATEMRNLTTQFPALDALVYWNAPGLGGYQVSNPEWIDGLLSTWVDRPEFDVQI